MPCTSATGEASEELKAKITQKVAKRKKPRAIKQTQTTNPNMPLKLSRVDTEVAPSCVGLTSSREQTQTLQASKMSSSLDDPSLISSRSKRFSTNKLLKANCLPAFKKTKSPPPPMNSDLHSVQLRFENFNRPSLQ